MQQHSYTTRNIPKLWIIPARVDHDAHEVAVQSYVVRLRSCKHCPYRYESSYSNNDEQRDQHQSETSEKS